MYLTEEEYLALLGRIDSLEKKKLKVDDLPMNDIAAQIQDQADWKGADVLLKKSVTQALLKDNAVGTSSRQAVPACRVYSSVGTNAAHNVLTTMSYDTERGDNTPGMHDLSVPTKITAVVEGWHLIVAHLQWPNNTAGSRRLCDIFLNGSAAIARDEKGPQDPHSTHSVPCMYYLNVGDYVEARAYQDSGGTLTIPASSAFQNEFSAIWLSK